MQIEDNLLIRKNECILCLSCINKCNVESLDIRISFPKIRINKSEFNQTRRDFIYGTLAAILIYPLFKFADKKIQRPKHLIRPPGSIPEEIFSQICAKCGSCMKACYTSGIQPLMFEFGVDNLFTPRMNNSVGFCGYECNDCGKVCPTGAIKFIPLEQKRQVVMGIAKIDHKICLPWAEKKPCITCEEMCPVPNKAIEFEERTAIFSDGITDKIKLPHVIPDNCIGCGICEYHCPTRPQRAIRVIYEGETRGGKIRETPPRERRFGFKTDDPVYWQ